MRMKKRFTAIALTALMTTASCVGLYADETVPAAQTAGIAPENTGDNKTEPDRDDKMEMSKLKLPEGFKAFDPEHVPDGKNAPADGELKPIEFDEDGNMKNGMKPENLPELPQDGRMPQAPQDGQMPQAPQDGQAPQAPQNGQNSRA